MERGGDDETECWVSHYSAAQINVVKGCVSVSLVHVTVAEFVWTARYNYKATSDRRYGAIDSAECKEQTNLLKKIVLSWPILTGRLRFEEAGPSGVCLSDN